MQLKSLYLGIKCGMMLTLSTSYTKNIKATVKIMLPLADIPGLVFNVDSDIYPSAKTNVIQISEQKCKYVNTIHDSVHQRRLFIVM